MESKERATLTRGLTILSSAAAVEFPTVAWALALPTSRQAGPGVKGEHSGSSPALSNLRSMCQGSGFVGVQEAPHTLILSFFQRPHPKCAGNVLQRAQPGSFQAPLSSV